MKTKDENEMLRQLFDAISDMFDVILKQEYDDEIMCWSFNEEEEWVSFEFYKHKPIVISISGDSVRQSMLDIIRILNEHY